MASGGARARSGPAKDPNSRTSERAGFKLTPLPAEGRKGRAPAFPLPKASRAGENREAAAREATALRKRELEIWRGYWAQPQAVVWEREPWRWSAVGMVCRLEAIIEAEPDANASLIGQLHRYRDDVGLSQAGIKLNGWQIVAAKDAATAPAADSGTAKPKRERRLRVVDGAQQ